MTSSDYNKGLALLRQTLTISAAEKNVVDMIAAQKVVLAQFQPIFHPRRVEKLTKEDFWSFLSFDGNRHWTGLVRQAPRLCAQMPRLRRTLAALLNEKEPVTDRLDSVFRNMPGMGRAIATAVLHVVHPDKYGVWNGTSENGMKFCGVWPDFERGEGDGHRYLRINEVLLRLAEDLRVNLWVLDMLWWRVQREADSGTEMAVAADSSLATMASEGLGFGLERHLHEFLRDNWDQTSPGREWRLYSEEGNEDAGYEYPCGVGRIDLLARHRKKASWLVVELKRNQTSDVTVAQILRYMGWVRQHLAAPGESVRGLIIARHVDNYLQYALLGNSEIDVQLYEVDFRLLPQPNSIQDGQPKKR